MRTVDAAEIEEVVALARAHRGLQIGDVLRALGCAEGMLRHASDWRTHVHTLRGSDAVTALRSISHQPGAYILAPWTVLDLACSDPQALAYACGDPWLRLLVVLAVVDGTTKSEDSSYSKYSSFVDDDADNGTSIGDAISVAQSGDMYHSMVCAASLLWSDMALVREIERGLPGVCEMLEEFVHAALGAWNSTVVFHGFEPHQQIVRRLCVDVRACTVHSHLRYDPDGDYTWYGMAEGELPKATRIAPTGDGDNLWRWIEFLAALYDAEANTANPHTFAYRPEHQARLTELATALSGRP